MKNLFKIAVYAAKTRFFTIELDPELTATDAPKEETTVKETEKAESEKQDETNAPVTGDTSNKAVISIICGIILAAVIVVVIIVVLKKKKK